MPSSLPIRLDLALAKGNKCVLVFNHDERKSPPVNKRWLILSGYIHHVTTKLSFLVHGVKDITSISEYSKVYWSTAILAADATGSCPLFNTEPATEQSQFQFIIVSHDECLWFAGDAHADKRCVLTVLEW